jgi:hypothetical protein
MGAPAAATLETYNIIFTPSNGPAPSGSFTVNVTCSSCTLTTVSTFDIIDAPAEWTPPDPSFFTLTVNGSGLVTSLAVSGMLDSLPPGHPTVHDLFLSFGPGNAYHIAGSDSTINPVPPGANGTYELVQVAAVPESAASALLLAGLAGYGIMARLRRHLLSR